MNLTLLKRKDFLNQTGAKVLEKLRLAMGSNRVETKKFIQKEQRFLSEIARLDGLATIEFASHILDCTEPTIYALRFKGTIKRSTFQGLISLSDVRRYSVKRKQAGTHIRINAEQLTFDEFY